MKRKENFEPTVDQRKGFKKPRFNPYRPENKFSLLSDDVKGLISQYLNFEDITKAKTNEQGKMVNLLPENNDYQHVIVGKDFDNFVSLKDKKKFYISFLKYKKLIVSGYEFYQQKFIENLISVLDELCKQYNTAKAIEKMKAKAELEGNFDLLNQLNDTKTALDDDDFYKWVNYPHEIQTYGTEPPLNLYKAISDRDEISGMAYPWIFHYNLDAFSLESEFRSQQVRIHWRFIMNFDDFIQEMILNLPPFRTIPKHSVTISDFSNQTIFAVELLFLHGYMEMDDLILNPSPLPSDFFHFLKKIVSFINHEKFSNLIPRGNFRIVNFDQNQNLQEVFEITKYWYLYFKKPVFIEIVPSDTPRNMKILAKFVEALQNNQIPFAFYISHCVSCKIYERNDNLAMLIQLSKYLSYFDSVWIHCDPFKFGENFALQCTGLPENTTYWDLQVADTQKALEVVTDAIHSFLPGFNVYRDVNKYWMYKATMPLK